MENQIEIYTTRDNETTVEVRFEKETVWLNRNQLSLLFDRDVKTITRTMLMSIDPTPCKLLMVE